ncbi:MAG: hypothetical protein ACEQSX_01245 [Baekduiaceae bacterium]
MPPSATRDPLDACCAAAGLDRERSDDGAWSIGDASGQVLVACRRGAGESATNPWLSFPATGLEFELVLDMWEDDRFYIDDVRSWDRVPESLVQQIVLGGARIISERGGENALWRDAEGWPVTIETLSPSLWVPADPATAWTPADALAFTGDPPRLPGAAKAEPEASVVDLVVPGVTTAVPVAPDAADALAETSTRVEVGLRTLGEPARLPSCGAAWVVERDGRAVFVELRFDHEVSQHETEFSVIGTGDLRHDILVDDRSIVGGWIGRTLQHVFGGTDLAGILRVVEAELEAAEPGGPLLYRTINLMDGSSVA